MKRKSLLALVAAVMLVASCGTGTPSGGGGNGTVFPLAYTDSFGRTVTIQKSPERIVSLSPNVTEILYKLGAQDRIVGRCQYCDYPEATSSIEGVGDIYAVNCEKILSLQADIVFVTGMSSFDSVKQLEDAGIPVIAYEYTDVESIYQNIADLGKITQKPEAADALIASLKADFADLLQMADGVEKKKVFIDLWGYWSSNKDYFLGSNLQKIADNIAYDQPNGQLSAEFIIQMNPDVYICLEPEADFLSHKPAAFDELNAFKNNKVFFFSSTDPNTGAITRQGPRFVEGLKLIFNLTYGD